jgi:hypothetical protein
MMSVLKMFAAAALLSMVAIPSASAQYADPYMQQEPAAYQAQYPNRDVLNGGALTPAGRMGLERAGGAAPAYSGAYPAYPSAYGAYQAWDQVPPRHLRVRRH